jgi:hypothetical protein
MLNSQTPSTSSTEFSRSPVALLHIESNAGTIDSTNVHAINSLNHSLHIKELIRKYNGVVTEYFTIMIQSKIVGEMEDKHNIFFIGLNTIMHTFKLIFQLTCNINTTYQLCQKACYYYLEYIEQTIENDTTTNLVSELNQETKRCKINNHNDVVIFVYNKTINGIRPSGRICSVDGIITTAQLSEASTEQLRFLKNLSFITNTLINWNNLELSPEQRLIMCQKYLTKYLTLFSSCLDNISTNLNTTLSPMAYIKLVQSKVQMNYEKYDEFIYEYYKKSKNLQMNNLFPSESELFNIGYNLFYKQTSDLERAGATAKQGEGERLNSLVGTVCPLRGASRRSYSEFSGLDRAGMRSNATQCEGERLNSVVPVGSRRSSTKTFVKQLFSIV